MRRIGKTIGTLKRDIIVAFGPRLNHRISLCLDSRAHSICIHSTQAELVYISSVVGNVIIHYYEIPRESPLSLSLRVARIYLRRVQSAHNSSSRLLPYTPALSVLWRKIEWRTFIDESMNFFEAVRGEREYYNTLLILYIMNALLVFHFRGIFSKSRGFC